jgi:hypothetical protein
MTPVPVPVAPGGQPARAAAKAVSPEAPPEASAPDSPVLLLTGGGDVATLLQLIDPLDEPDFYCVDVPGFGAGLDLAAALSAHTCKPGADDEMFRPGEPLAGNLQMPAYRLCLEAAAAAPGSELFLMECSDSALQQFSLAGNGALRLAETPLCLTIAPGAGEPTGGPSHLRRDLALEDCGAAPANRRSWQMPGPT